VFLSLQSTIKLIQTTSSDSNTSLTSEKQNTTTNMAGEKKPKPLQVAKLSDQNSDRRSTLETNPPKSQAWWIDETYAYKSQPFLNPRTAKFIAYRSFRFGKGPDQFNGQTYRYMTALEDEYMQKIGD
jgi:hypothetical protein